MSATAWAHGRRDLQRDERGAVMLLGIFMACFLIGALWFVIGIGDALVFRDTMQEAADHTVFTAATVHARGMNFIAALNLVMLAAVAVYLAMGIISDALILLGGLIAVFDGSATFNFGLQMRNNVWIPYFRVMKPVLQGVSFVETGAALAMPWGGTVAGVMVSDRYGQTGLTFSPSMVPGAAINALLPGGGGGSSPAASKVDPSQLPPTTGSGGSSALQNVQDTKLGLPVQHAPFKSLCGLTARLAVDWLFDQIKKIPVVDAALGIPLLGRAVRKGIEFAVNKVGQLVEVRYCGFGAMLSESDKKSGEFDDALKEAEEAAKEQGTEIAKKTGTAAGSGAASIDPSLDTFWGEDGPKHMWGQAQNGNDWMQVWGFVINGELTDTSERRVGFAQRVFDTAPTTPPAPTYNAQAEFYFDCDEQWSGESCNGGNFHHAMYSMRWRARLRRVRSPDIASMLTGWLGETILNGKMLGYLNDKLKNSGAFGRANERTTTFVDKLSGGKGGKFVDKAFDWFVGKKPGSTSFIGKQGGKLRGKLAGGGSGIDESLGIYH